VELTAAGRPPRRAARLDGWSAGTALIALVVGAPLVALPLSFVLEGTGPISKFSHLIPEAVVATVLLVAGVGAGTLVLGTALAALVSFCEFPGRRSIEWALALPLAMPGYVFTLFALGTLGRALPGIRSPMGAIIIFTLVLYPYVYLLARAAFLSQSRELFEAARSLGLGPTAAVLRVAAPLARPAVFGGALLAVMEALADFGTVNLLGVHTFTDAIYRVWFNAFDRQAAMQLGALLASVSLTLLLVERTVRGRAGHTQDLGHSSPLPRTRLRGWQAAAATGFPLLLLVVVVVAPVTQLLVWAGQSIDQGLLSPQFAGSARNSLLFAGTSALIVGGVALAMAYGLRASRARFATGAVRFATIGYGLPGSVVAATVIVPLAWLDHRAGTLLFTGTALGLFAAYLVRFAALAFQSVDASLTRIPHNLDDAARGLGADRLTVLGRVHLPLMRTGLLTGGLLVFSEVVKELPATMLLRPLGSDTLAIEVWQATTESLWQTAALPAVMIVAVGLVPIVLLMRATESVPR
jgi:iron(III) transport system permease protein